jgi:putative Holliday junction resolvase
VVPSDRLSQYLCTLLAEEDIAEVVVGVPKTLSGEVGSQARRALDIVATLRGEFPAVRFVEWDERLTTRMARSSPGGTRIGFRKGGRADRRKRVAKERVDHLAAAGMLQEYLDRRGAFEATRQDPS